MTKLRYLVMVLALVGCTKAEYVSAPVEFCTRTPTGRTQESMHMQCYPSGNNPCGMQMPVYTTYTEYNYSCNWSKYE